MTRTADDRDLAAERIAGEYAADINGYGRVWSDETYRALDRRAAETTNEWYASRPAPWPTAGRDGRDTLPSYDVRSPLYRPYGPAGKAV